MNHRQAGLTDADAVECYRWMLLTRRLDERLGLLHRGGEVHVAVSSKGHEAAQVGVALAFRPGRDWWFPYYRDLGAVLVAGSTPFDLMLASFGRKTDPASGGRQTPYNWGNRRLNIVARSAPVAVQIPQAAGVAAAAQRHGDDVVVYCSFGDGAASQGDFHEGLNWAALQRLPVIYICQNNGWAISVPFEKQTAGGSVGVRARAYGMAGRSLDGTDPFAVFAAASEAHARARAGDGPALLELRVPRMESHSCDDNHRAYRTLAELGSAVTRDPLASVRRYLVDTGLLPEPMERDLERAVVSALDTDEERARAVPRPLPEDAMSPSTAD